jgi:hypothetical protein
MVCYTSTGTCKDSSEKKLYELWYGRYGRGPPQAPSPVQNVADLASLLELKV